MHICCIIRQAKHVNYASEPSFLFDAEKDDVENDKFKRSFHKKFNGNLNLNNANKKNCY